MQQGLRPGTSHRVGKVQVLLLGLLVFGASRSISLLGSGWVHLSPAPGEAVPKKSSCFLKQSHLSRLRTFLSPPSAQCLVGAVSSLVRGRIHGEIPQGRIPILPGKSTTPQEVFWHLNSMLRHLLQPQELFMERQHLAKTPWTPGRAKACLGAQEGPCWGGNIPGIAQG